MKNKSDNFQNWIYIKPNKFSYSIQIKSCVLINRVNSEPDAVFNLIFFNIGLQSLSGWFTIVVRHKVFFMPTIVIASPKGGSGKSTTAVLLGTEFAHAGVRVTFIDCDPNRSLSMWSKKAALPPRVSVLSNVTDVDIVRTIKDNDRDGHIIIIDLEGVASRLVSRAISRADLVLTPMRATSLDAAIGIRTVELIAEEEEVLGRSIQHAVVFTMTRGVRSKQHLEIERSLKRQGVTVIDPPLMERSAFSALFAFGGDLRTIPEQGRMKQALDNASAFATAVYKQLTGDRHEQRATFQHRHQRSQKSEQREHRADVR